VSAPWNLQSKRFLLVAALTAAYIVLLFVAPEVAAPIAPYTYGMVVAYCGVESWKPTGVDTAPKPDNGGTT